MKVENVHKRIINLSKAEFAVLLDALSTKGDKVWPNDNWPKIYFKNGLKVGSVGGHGIIKYLIEEYIRGELIVFRFIEPKGFNGIHKFEIEELNENTIEVKHSIIMNTEGVMATLSWITAIRWLHDALIENASQTVQQFSKENMALKTLTIFQEVIALQD